MAFISTTGAHQRRQTRAASACAQQMDASQREKRVHAFRIQAARSYIEGYTTGVWTLQAALHACEIAHQHVQQAPCSTSERATAPIHTLILQIQLPETTPISQLARRLALHDGCVIARVARIDARITRIDGATEDGFGAHDADGVCGKAVADAEDWFFEYDCTI